jgi:hypothetical protein
MKKLKIKKKVMKKLVNNYKKKKVKKEKVEEPARIKILIIKELLINKGNKISRIK